ncbi:uncharacterized protein AMSG_01413 [Thecamonas trahens ATCC 50062]|uniref:Uncharacterized protein n=1 Tax=Thecamonas trahens ATCC 50062 TaxID=461836 RepID=A0A0L0DN20_THETB|nr:hypothetical protein AMSG_01413 [Thecamonas trahens ATCC 50062]KNC53702.1 hypothetical protein AMSG_01413 [Thecamonas trahens ATCC 50062]|eukprot:XP_013762016.1 hypothetical protein AMSG_01413 [Thecamonas trahens ATCC 50062]
MGKRRRTPSPGAPATNHLPSESRESDSDDEPLSSLRLPPRPPPLPIESHTPSHILALLKEHQVDGIRFLWRAVVLRGSGGVLAHTMGLGKTLQAIVLAAAFLRARVGSHVLVVAPVNVVGNWAAEFARWFAPPHSITVTVADESLGVGGRQALKAWKRLGGVAVIGYEQVVSLLRREQTRELLRELPHLVIADEGHRLKNAATATWQALASISTPRRVVLTGSPLQNNLEEYFHMVEYVAAGYLGDVASFRTKFGKPIAAGSTMDSSLEAVKLSRERIVVLHSILAPVVHRRDYSVVASTLPPKTDVVLFCKLSYVQRRLYRRWLAEGTRSLFKAYHTLLKVWNHPDTLVAGGEGEVDDASSHGGCGPGRALDVPPLGGLIPDDLFDAVLLGEPRRGTGAKQKDDAAAREPPRSLFTSYLAGAPEAAARMSAAREREKKQSTVRHGRGARPQRENWYAGILDRAAGYVAGRAEVSGKMVVALELLRRVWASGERALVFSQSLAVLDMFEKHLADNEFAGLAVFRLDGSTRAGQRQEDIAAFNSAGRGPRVYLISTRAGCVGINLVTATRAILFDVSWNPAHDLQATYRLYRFGQQRPVFIYRLVSDGTMEAKIFGRQMLKQSLALRVVDDAVVERFFHSRALRDLFELVERDECEIDADVVTRDAWLQGVVDSDAGGWILGCEDVDAMLGSGAERALSVGEKTAILAEWDVLQVLEAEQRKLVAREEVGMGLRQAKAGMRSGLVAVDLSAGVGISSGK